MPEARLKTDVRYIVEVVWRRVVEFEGGAERWEEEEGRDRIKSLQSHRKPGREDAVGAGV